MTWNWLSFVVGALLGAMLGILTICLRIAARRGDEYPCDTSDVQ